MRTLAARAGPPIPRLGLGTWTMGEDSRRRAEEVAALRLGFDLGLTLVDTAEMYAEGGAEAVVGEALRGRRDEVYVVSKVLPDNASRTGTVRAAERSLRRLGIEAIDLYLLHWVGPHPLEETLAAFADLEQDGKVRAFGVSNFDPEKMQEAWSLPAGDRIAANQVMYNLQRRGIERRLLPWCRSHDVVLMAYSPLEQGRLQRRPALRAVAQRHGVTEEQVALAWTLRLDHVVTLVKAARSGHVRQAAAASDLELSAEDLAELDRDYPAPDHDVPLEML